MRTIGDAQFNDLVGAHDNESDPLSLGIARADLSHDSGGSRRSPEQRRQQRNLNLNEVPIFG